MKNKLLKQIEDIQNGKGLKRQHFPEDKKGHLAKELWNDCNFSYGMEYGYLLALIDLVDENEE